jgi:hypothetical protein
MNNGEPKSLDRQALKRKYLECFNVRTTNADTWREVVTSLISRGIARETLVSWGVDAGYPKITVSSMLSRILCAIGLRQRREGAGRKPSQDAIALLDYARRQYGERFLKVLRAAMRAGKAQTVAINALPVAPETGKNKNKCGAAIRRAAKPPKINRKSRLGITGNNFEMNFNTTIKPRYRTRSKL